MKKFDFDLFVIGAGSAGVRAARVAARHGAKVAIIEADRVGGTCVIRGCVPKKLMVLAGRFADGFHDARGFGWNVGEIQHSWPALIESKDREILRLESLYVSGLESADIRLLKGYARLVDEHTIEVRHDLRQYTSRHIVIATGGRPIKDEGVAGIEHAVTSDEIFELGDIPKRTTIVGGGYIAVEFAGLLQSLGSQVTLIHRGDHLLRGFDEDLRTGLEAAYSARGIDVRLNANVESIGISSGGKVITYSDGTQQTSDTVMYAIGRKPNSAGLGLEGIGVRFDKDAIVVDAYSTTNVPSVHAVGDVTNRATLTPVAIREGHALADTLFGGRPTVVNHAIVPTAVFSTPEIGCVGYTEQAARDARKDISIFQTSFRPMKATLSGRFEEILMKLIVDVTDDRVIGVHILGEGAGEMIQLAGVALSCGAKKADFDATIAVHPTAAEELVTMRNEIR